MKYIKFYTNISTYFLFLIFIFTSSCSKEDDPILIDPQDPQVETPAIGLKFYGEKASSDQGIRMFKTDNGYLSFEIQNDFTSSVNGFSDILIRTIDEKLITTNTKILSSSAFDQIKDVAKIDDNKFIVVGSTGTVSTIKEESFPIIKIMDANGEVIKSLIIGNPQTNANTNNGSLTNVVFKDNIIYTTVSIKNNQTSIVALDLDLNLLWSKLYTNSRFANLTVDDTHVYFVSNNYKPSDNLYNIVSLKKLDKTNGNEIFVKEYTNVEGDFNYEFTILKIIQNQNNIFLAGMGGRVEKPSIGFISQGIILNINKSDGTELPRMVFPETWYIRDIEFYDNGFITSSWTNRSFIRISKLNTDGTIVWKFDHNHRQNDVVYDLGINTDNSVFFTGSVDVGTGDRDVIYGILKSDGKLK